MTITVEHDDQTDAFVLEAPGKITATLAKALFDAMVEKLGLLTKPTGQTPRAEQEVVKPEKRTTVAPIPMPWEKKSSPNPWEVQPEKGCLPKQGEIIFRGDDPAPYTVTYLTTRGE